MVKQVIVMRRDLNMRRGKEIAQGAHAAMAFLLKAALQSLEHFDTQIDFSGAAADWLDSGMTKVCLQVHSEAELMEIHDAAVAAGLTVSLITDAGKTEFNGVPTRTCLAIGPDLAEDIDKITGHLKLY